jgi:hypothetical protein
LIPFIPRVFYNNGTASLFQKNENDEACNTDFKMKLFKRSKLYLLFS